MFKIQYTRAMPFLYHFKRRRSCRRMICVADCDSSVSPHGAHQPRHHGRLHMVATF